MVIIRSVFASKKNGHNALCGPNSIQANCGSWMFGIGLPKSNCGFSPNDGLN